MFMFNFYNVFSNAVVSEGNKEMSLFIFYFLLKWFQFYYGVIFWISFVHLEEY